MKEKILVKIRLARTSIRSTNLKKEGHNEFSHYDYFTPEQVDTLVSGAEAEFQFMCVFNLKRNEYGEYGELTVYDLESDDFFVTEMATRIGEMKATNATQQAGGTVTYTERYMKMTLFGIKDNRLDPDSWDNTQKNEAAVPPEAPKKAKAGDGDMEKIKLALEGAEDEKQLDALKRAAEKKFTLSAIQKGAITVAYNNAKAALQADITDADIEAALDGKLADEKE